MPFSAYLNDIPQPAWIVATVLAFIFFWPLGIALLGYLIGSGRIGWRCMQQAPGQWHNTQTQQGSYWGKWGGWQQQPPAPPSGNAAFDEYKAETLRRLEEEQKEFVDYLERLRRAKDKAEFDQFMAQHKANHLQVAYATDADTADRALAAKAATFQALGVEVHLCGEGVLGRQEA